MSRGKGSKSKFKGRIAGYETADFSIVSTTTQTQPSNIDSGNMVYVHNAKLEKHIFKKIGKVLIYIIVIPFAVFLTIGAIASSCDKNNNSKNTYIEPKIITPESSMGKPNAFTQRQLDVAKERDKNVDKLLAKDWTMTDGAEKSNMYVVVGKDWEAISSNQSPIMKVSTRFKYPFKNQDYQITSIELDLQETKAGAGITVDATAVNILNLHSPSMNIDSIKSSVQAAYSSTVNSKPYRGTLSFGDDSVYIDGRKSGRLVNVSIKVTTFINK